MDETRMEGATEEEMGRIRAVLSAFPFRVERYPRLGDLAIRVVDPEEPFKPHVRDWDERYAIIDEPPRSGGVFVHGQDLLILRRPIDDHLVAHEYAHAVDQAMGFASDREPFLGLYHRGGRAISNDAYFSQGEWFAENLAAQMGWTQDGRRGEDARERLREIEPAAAAAFARLVAENRIERPTTRAR